MPTEWHSFQAIRHILFANSWLDVFQRAMFLADALVRTTGSSGAAFARRNQHCVCKRLRCRRPSEVTTDTRDHPDSCRRGAPALSGHTESPICPRQAKIPRKLHWNCAGNSRRTARQVISFAFVIYRTLKHCFHCEIFKC